MCTRPDRDAGAACYSYQVGMSGGGFSDSRRNVEMNVKGESTWRGGKQLQLPFLYQGRCSITVVRRLPGLSSGREACQAPLSYTISLSLIKLMSIELVMLSNHLTLCCPLLLLPSIFCFWVLCNESAINIRWPMYCSFSINPSSEYSKFISFRIDGFVLLAVQGILKAHL